MSALAHEIEVRGVPTTVVGLVRPHLEKSQPPRAIFVPFQLGRPFGEPDDKALQRRVMMAALSLFERTDGPVILEDFPEEAPGRLDTHGWKPPFQLPQAARPANNDVEGWSRKLTEEMQLVELHYARAVAQRGRTTVGISAQPPHAWPAFAAAFLGPDKPAPPPGLPTSAVALRFLCDDLKAYYSEAAMSSGSPPSSRQLDQWFWRETLAGGFLQAVRKAGMASDINALKTVAGRFFVPAPYVEA
ncbi:MAG: hypothetical protein R3D67_07485 [Hyphomicrobiaceae bacterium]